MSYLLSLPHFTYCIEMFLALFLFWLPLEKRKLSFLRFAAGIILLIVESVWVGPWLQKQGIHIWFFVVFVTLLAICVFSSSISLWEGLYCLSCAYLTQHFASASYLFLFQMGWIPTEGIALEWLYPLLYFTV